MDLPLQTQVLVDGQWITRTIDAHTLLQQHNQMNERTANSTSEMLRPPVRGILTQTVIPSPLVHWILPIRLRGQEYNDVAFIGVSRRSFACHGVGGFLGYFLIAIIHSISASEIDRSHHITLSSLHTPGNIDDIVSLEIVSFHLVNTYIATFEILILN